MIYLEEYRPRQRAAVGTARSSRGRRLRIVCEVIALSAGIVVLLLSITTINTYGQMRAIAEMWVKAWRLI